MIWLLVERINYAEFAAAFYNMDWRFFMAAILLMPFNICGQIVKWRFLLKHLKKRITWKECALSLLTGITLGFVTPGRLGEFGRAFFVEDVPRSHVAVLVLIEKLISAFIIGFLGTWSLYIMVRLGYFTGGEKLWFSAATLFSLAIFGLLLFSKKTLNVIITIYRYLIKREGHNSQEKSIIQQ
ncbi:flippase-like domain-containing protein, partial [bacterium]|nr:flippase-like domain-containing protein [bacterium]